MVLLVSGVFDYSVSAIPCDSSIVTRRWLWLIAMGHRPMVNRVGWMSDRMSNDTSKTAMQMNRPCSNGECHAVKRANSAILS